MNIKSLNRIVHNVYYLSCLFIIVAVCTMPISFMEKGFHTFAWTYLIIVYAYFFDDCPPKLLRIRQFVEENEQEVEFLNELFIISRDMLSLMRKIQFHQDPEVVSQSIDAIKRRRSELLLLTPPDKYRQEYDEIMQNVNDFLDFLQEENVRGFATARTI